MLDADHDWRASADHEAALTAGSSLTLEGKTSAGLRQGAASIHLEWDTVVDAREILFASGDRWGLARITCGNPKAVHSQARR